MAFYIGEATWPATTEDAMNPTEEYDIHILHVQSAGSF